MLSSIVVLSMEKMFVKVIFVNLSSLVILSMEKMMFAKVISELQFVTGLKIFLGYSLFGLLVR